MFAYFYQTPNALPGNIYNDLHEIFRLSRFGADLGSQIEFHQRIGALPDQRG